MQEGDPLSIDIGKVEFVDITKENVQIVKQLNDRIFDIIYQPPFYKHILHHAKRNFNKLLKYGPMNIGVVLCRYFYLDENLDSDMKLPDGFCGFSSKEHQNIIVNGSDPVSLESQTNEAGVEDTAEAGTTTTTIRDGMIYIAAFGLIPMFRSHGIGKLMIKHVYKLADETAGVKYIGLHVHSPNKEAIKFYKRHGFSAAQLIENYYHRLEPRSAYLLACIPKALTSPEKSHIEESKSQE